MELTSLTISEATELIRGREISPVELAQAHLERIEKLNPLLNAYLTVTGESALEEAQRADAEIARREYRGPLHGIPLALKDLYETSGVRTTAGSRFFSDYLPEQDAETVHKLREAGAVLLGKLNMHEIALGVTNVNPHYGPARNPWDPQRITGGSSGGSGAALVAGLCLGSLGSDTGGSIRIPASLCGVVGLKPTYGRVSLRGVIPLSWNLDHAGPLARRVRDAAVLLQTIAGYDPLDPASSDYPVDDYLVEIEAGVRGWRVALATGEYIEQSAPEVVAMLAEAGKVFEGLGARVEPVELPDLRRAAQANGLLTPADAAAYHKERLETHPELFGEDVLARLRTGAGFTSTEYSLARRTAVELRRQFERFFQQYTVLLLPATPDAAAPIEGGNAIERARALTRFTAPFNLTGMPALSVPGGFTQSGLPLGLQIVAAPWQEARLLRAGYAFEQATDWHTRRPEISAK